MVKKTHSSMLAASAATAAMLAFSGPAAAQQTDLFGKQPRVDVTVPGVVSQAQLAHQLHSQGYNNIKLSSQYPTPADPNPENHSRSDPETTPIHQGWNGTAFKDGRRLRVYVQYGSGPSVAEVPAK